MWSLSFQAEYGWNWIDGATGIVSGATYTKFAAPQNFMFNGGYFQLAYTLTGENRVIVAHGLRGLGSVHNPGLRALLDVAGGGRVLSRTQAQAHMAGLFHPLVDLSNAAVGLFAGGQAPLGFGDAAA
mgnify:CR=1 FL=1